MASRRRVGGLVLAAGLSAAGLAGQASAQLRVVAWNISNYTGGRDADIKNVVYAQFAGRSLSPDVIMCLEFTSQAAVDNFRNDLNTAPGSPGGWASAPFMDGADTDAAFFYRTSKVVYLGTTIAGYGSSDTNNQPRNTYRYDLRPVGYEPVPSASLACYAVHMKAQGGTNDVGRRLIEAQRIRANAAGADATNLSGADVPGTGLPAGWNFLVGGDMNAQTSSEAFYVEYVGSQADNTGRFFDPIHTPGSWNNNGTYKYIHTQDPSGTGGMDDRHDQILICAALMNNGGLTSGTGMGYIGSPTLPFSTTTWNDPNHSYRCWGNDGNSFNLPLNTSGNANCGDIIAQSIKICATTAGGHCPVYLDMRVPAKLSAPTSIDFGTVTQGSVASQSIDVGNGGNTALWTAAGIANISYTLGASAGFTAPSGSFIDAPGGALNAHAITMNTSSPGPKNGTLTITSTGADEPTRVITITGNVVASNLPPIADAGPDQTLVDSDHSGDQPVTLDGSQSHDPDGTITNYNWSEGPTLLAQGSSASTPTVTLAVGVHTITLLVTDDMSATATDTVVITVSPGSTCGSADFNHDGDLGTDADIAAFFACLGGFCCPACDSADFNGDGDLGTDTDIEAFFRVLGGGPC